MGLVVSRAIAASNQEVAPRLGTLPRGSYHFDPTMLIAQHEICQHSATYQQRPRTAPFAPSGEKGWG